MRRQCGRCQGKPECCVTELDEPRIKIDKTKERKKDFERFVDLISSRRNHCAGFPAPTANGRANYCHFLFTRERNKRYPSIIIIDTRTIDTFEFTRSLKRKPITDAWKRVNWNRTRAIDENRSCRYGNPSSFAPLQRRSIKFWRMAFRDEAI